MAEDHCNESEPDASKAPRFVARVSVGAPSFGDGCKTAEGRSVQRSQRLRGFDVLRGFSVVSMVSFHFCYDLAYLWGAPLSWFESPFQDVWRASISWVFLALAGIMCAYSRNNLKRGLRYLSLALAIYAVTYLAQVDTPISFGIIYCMGFSTILVGLLRRFGLGAWRGWRAWVLSSCILALFLLTLAVPSGSFGLAWAGGPSVRMPVDLYQRGLLSWLGFPGPRFASGDYYPPLPFSLVFVAAYVWWQGSEHAKITQWLAKLSCAPLEWVGRHPLSIYVLHQPLLLVLSYVLASIWFAA